MTQYSRKHESRSGSAVLNEPVAELYREIFTHSNDAIAIIDSEGHYLEQNAAHRTLMGYDDEELYGHTPEIHLGKEAFAKISQALFEKGEYRGEVTSRTKDGQLREIELSAFTMRDADGVPLCYVGIKRDISERKQNQKALQRSEAELADFFENAAIGMHWIGPEGYIVRVNQAELDLLGYMREEYIGHHISEFHADKETINEILTRLQT